MGYYYEKNNVEQLKTLIDLNEERKKKTYEQQYVEYQYIDPYQYTVSIEYCANCNEHKTHTRHSQEMYKNFALKIQKCIAKRSRKQNLKYFINSKDREQTKIKTKNTQNAKEIKKMRDLNQII